MKDYKPFPTQDYCSEVGITSEDLPSSPEQPERDVCSRKLKDAVASLWDRETRSEIEEEELNRFASAKRLIRKRQFERAKAVLQFPHPVSAESLNVLGIIHELLKDFNSARSCYGQARSVDKNCMAAQMNGRRIYELHTFGKSAIPVYL